MNARGPICPRTVPSRQMARSTGVIAGKLSFSVRLESSGNQAVTRTLNTCAAVVTLLATIKAAGASPHSRRTRAIRTRRLERRPSGSNSAKLHAAFFTKSAQRVQRMAVDEMAQFRECFVGSEIGTYNHPYKLFRTFNYARTRQNPHLADE